MKNTFVALFFSLTSCIGFAQTKTDSSSHLTFKGVPLDGTLDQYVTKMKQTGFSHISTKDGIAILKGDFAGYKDCIVAVSTLKQKDLVHKIGVMFSEKDTWSSLSGNYFQLKEMLTEKYGQPSIEVEKFDMYKEPDDDGTKMFAVKYDNCKYHSFWEIDKGKIQLSIDHDGVTRCFVKLVYFDKVNGEAIKKQALDDL